VFVTRYLDLFHKNQWTADKVYLIFFKLFYIFSSFYIVFLMVKVFARTREREKSWKLASWSVLCSAIGAPIAIAIWSAIEKEEYPQRWFTEVRVVQTNRPRTRLIVAIIDDVGVFDYSGICLRPSTAPVVASDHGPYGH
jgi:hypothetical protein